LVDVPGGVSAVRVLVVNPHTTPSMTATTAARTAPSRSRSCRTAGEVVAFHEYDVLDLQAGRTSVMVQTSGNAPPCLIGTTVSIVVDDLEIY
jgi:hypothetical protein